MAQVETSVPVRALTVGGETVTGDETRVVRAPWDGAALPAVPLISATEARTAVAAAAQAMRKPLHAHERAEILDRAAATIRERREELARLLSREIGKPLKQAFVEVDRCVQTLTFSAIEARTLTGRSIPVDAHPAGTGRRGYTIRVPIGVVAAITPFNFPLNLAAHKVGPAVAAGCGTVLKPAAVAPLAAIELVRTLHEAGLPPELLSVVTGQASEIGNVLVEDERVRMITFTGSAEVGWELAARAAKKHVSLELGNSTPLIVCADADLDAAAESAAISGNGFAGQSCISVQRVLVDGSVHDDFAERLVAAVERLKVGNPTDDDTDVGPLIDEDARTRVGEWLDEATDKGAERLAGVLSTAVTYARQCSTACRPTCAPGSARSSVPCSDSARSSRSTRRSNWRTTPTMASRPASSPATSRPHLRQASGSSSAESRSTRRPPSASTRCPTGGRKGPGTRARVRTTPCAT